MTLVLLLQLTSGVGMMVRDTSVLATKAIASLPATYTIFGRNANQMSVVESRHDLAEVKENVALWHRSLLQEN